MIKWLITGGCGFIGTNLVKALVSQEENCISMVDNFSVGTHRPNFCDVKIIGDNILDENHMVNITKDVDIIVHLAANTGIPLSIENPKMNMLANAFGTFIMLEAARLNGVKKFIFASSGAAGGEPDEKISHPVSPYGASKLAGEAYCSAYYHTYGIKTTVLRFSNVYGPGSEHKNSIVAKFIRQAMSNEPLDIYGTGNQTRDFIYVDDIVQAILCVAMKDDIGGQTFQIAIGHETKVTELTKKLIVLLSDSGSTNIRVQHSAPRAGDLQRSSVDVSRTKQVLGWEAQTDLSQGLKKTIEWFKSVTEGPMEKIWR